LSVQLGELGAMMERQKGGEGNWKGGKSTWTGKRTAALEPRRHEQPLESAVAISVQLCAKLGSAVAVALFMSSGAGVGSRLFFCAGKVALRAGTVVTVVTVDVLFN
jgi:hypothetical protein